MLRIALEIINQVSTERVADNVMSKRLIPVFVEVAPKRIGPEPHFFVVRLSSKLTAISRTPSVASFKSSLPS